MTRGQRAALLGVGFAIVVVAGALPFAHPAHRAASGTTTVSVVPPPSSSPGDSTEVSLAPVPSGPPVTAAPAPATPEPPTTTTVPKVVVPVAAPATTTTTAARTTTTTAPLAPIVTGANAVLAPPSSPQTRSLAADGHCESLFDPGFTGTCASVAARGTALIWLIESKSGGTAWRAFVLRPTGSGTASVVLQAIDDDGSDFAGVKEVSADLDGDSAPELVFGFRLHGSAQILSVDVVQGPGAVVVHRDYPDGSVRVGGGQLDGWGAKPGATTFTHEAIRFSDGAWRIIGTATDDPNAVPSSQL